MPKTFSHGKFLFLGAAVSLAAIWTSSGANAASVTQAGASHAAGSALHISAAGRGVARRPSVARHSSAPQACTTVNISQNVQYDLEEPTQTATAAMVINTPGTYSKLTVDGTGCDIGVYIAQSTQNVTLEDSVVHDATRAGVVADTANMVTLYGLSIYNTGDHNGTVFAPDGVQYGFDIDVDSTTNATVQDVSLTQYQKEGLLMYAATGSVSSDEAVGFGPVNFIAQNGFEIDSSSLNGANALSNNTAMLNQYTGPIYGAAGYILCGVTVNGVVLTPSLGVRQHLPGDQSLFNDIPYYIDQNPDC